MTGHLEKKQEKTVDILMALLRADQLKVEIQEKKDEQTRIPDVETALKHGTWYKEGLYVSLDQEIDIFQLFEQKEFRDDFPKGFFESIFEAIDYSRYYGYASPWDDIRKDFIHRTQIRLGLKYFQVERSELAPMERAIDPDADGPYTPTGGYYSDRFQASEQKIRDFLKLAVKHGLKISDDTHGMQSSDIEILKDGSIVIG